MMISGEVGGDDPLYLDDLQVGQRFTSKTHVVDAAQIKAFARQFDPQPFHLDDDAAKDSLFSGLVASGWHTAAITMRLLVERGLPLAGGVVGAGGELSWPRPTRPGDVLQVESEVLEIIPSRSRPDRGVSPVMDRTYFHSIYYREPGGVLFEIATDNPGFAVDETPDKLGTKLMLPAQYEPRRAEIDQIIPKVRLPGGLTIPGAP